MSYEDFKKELSRYGDFTEEEYREMYEAEMRIEKLDI